MSAPEIINSAGRGQVLILCDHASNHIPPELSGLGLPPERLGEHIAFDIGAAEVTRRLSALLDAPAILSTVSRLVVDVNRDPKTQNPIPVQSGGIPIAANEALSEAERKARLDAYFHPYHKACAAQLRRMKRRKQPPIVIGLHSFTPIAEDRLRPWEIGFLYDRDPRLFEAFRDLLVRRWRFTVGDNQPYSGKELYYTMARHGEAHGLLQATVEIRQDQIEEASGQERWAEILAGCLTQIRQRALTRMD